jgi:hypothetical protein
VAARGPRDRHRVEVGGLEQHVGGGVRDLGARAAHDSREADRAGVVGDQQVLGVEVAGGAVEGLELLPRPRAADHDRPAQLRPVIGVRGLTQLEHHVVGDVDREGDRPLAALLQPAAQPVRGRRRGVDAGDRERGETVAGRVLQADLPLAGAALARRHRATSGGVDEVDVVGRGDLAGDPPDRERVAAVRGDGDVEHLVVEPEHGLGVEAHLGARRQHDDPRVVAVGLAEFALGADHPVGDVAVGLAGRDLEVAGQDRAGQRHHDHVAHGEVACAADDPATARALPLGLVVLSSDVDPAVPDVLLQLLRLAQFLDREHPTGHQRAGESGRAGVHGLDLEARGDDPLGDLTTRHIGGQPGHELPDPGQRGAHQRSAPNGRLKRTSPSTMSRMSSASCRNITVRSMPMPKANPL